MQNEQFKLGEFSADIATLKDDVKEIKAKVESLNIWRWKIVGATSVVAILASLLTNYLFNI